MKKALNIAFIAIIMVFLAFGIGRTIAAPEEINELENRYSETIKAPTFKNIKSGDFQDSVELALADQIYGALDAKEAYNRSFSAFTMAALKKTTDIFGYNGEETQNEPEITEGQDPEEEDNENPNIDPEAENDPVTPENPTENDPDNPGGDENPSDNPGGSSNPSDDPSKKDTEKKEENNTSGKIPLTSEETKGEASTDPDKYVKAKNGVYIYKEHLVSLVSTTSANKKRINAKIDNYNKLIKKYPNLEFYLFYAEKDSDKHFVTGGRSGNFEYLSKNVNLDKSHFDRVYVDNYETFDKYYYRSDHHWKNTGSYYGYTKIINMLKPGEEPLQPLGEYLVGTFYGSRTGTEATAGFKDDLYAYDFPFPSMTITKAGKKISNYGNQEGAVSSAKKGDKLGRRTYSSVYGLDYGEIVFHNPTGEGSIIVFGNSFDNAVLKLIASHYEYTYSIDMRNYKRDTDKDFSFASYIKKHSDISTVLLMGNADFFISGAYLIPD